MWIFTKHGFFSIVCAHDGSQSNPIREVLMIRGRSSTHLKALQSDFAQLQSFEVSETEETDYRYRIVAPKEIVVSVFNQAMMDLDYSNFKKVVSKTEDSLYLHCLNEVWGIMLELQMETSRRRNKS